MKESYGKNRRKPAGRQKASARSGDYYLYGYHTVLAALKNPAREKIRLLLTENARQKLEGIDISCPVELATVQELQRKLGPEAVHQGIALQCRPLETLPLEAVEADIYVFLDQITDPHNIGAILRSAAAFGVGAVVTATRHAPQETAVMAKSASGALDLVPMIEVPNLNQALLTLKKQGVEILGFDSEGALNFKNYEKQRDRKLAIVLGAEGKGIRHKTREHCNAILKVPTRSDLASLNVSNAAAIIFYSLTFD